MRACSEAVGILCTLIICAGPLVRSAEAAYKAPEPRLRAEVEAVLAKAPKPPAAEKLRTLRIVLVAFKKDHGKNAHDYPLWQKRWAVLLGGKEATKSAETQVNLYGPALGGADALAGAPKVEISTAWGWPSKEQLASADLVVMFCYGRWDERKLTELEAFLARGGGFVAVHPTCLAARPLAPRLTKAIGLVFERGYTGYRHGAVALKIAAAGHPVTRGLPTTIRLVDETYFPLRADRGKVTVLATCDEKDKRDKDKIKPEPIFWACERGKGRVFGCILGHFVWTFDDPYARILLLRGMAWAAGESPYRFDRLVLRGAAVR